jgi:hypothetical protein
VKTCPVCSTEYPDDVRFRPNDGQTLRASSPAHDLVGQVVADRHHVLKKLNDLFDKFGSRALAATTIRDSALDIYNARGVAAKDRAFAAYVASNAYARLDDRTKARQYARESARLDPGNNSYQVLQNSLCQP